MFVLGACEKFAVKVVEGSILVDVLINGDDEVR